MLTVSGHAAFIGDPQVDTSARRALAWKDVLIQAGGQFVGWFRAYPSGDL